MTKFSKCLYFSFIKKPNAMKFHILILGATQESLRNDSSGAQKELGAGEEKERMLCTASNSYYFHWFCNIGRQ
jgi:hypothetical protein